MNIFIAFMNLVNSMWQGHSTKNQGFFGIWAEQMYALSVNLLGKLLCVRLLDPMHESVRLEAIAWESCIICETWSVWVPLVVIMAHSCSVVIVGVLSHLPLTGTSKMQATVVQWWYSLLNIHRVCVLFNSILALWCIFVHIRTAIYCIYQPTSLSQIWFFLMSQILHSQRHIVVVVHVFLSVNL